MKKLFLLLSICIVCIFAQEENVLIEKYKIVTQDEEVFFVRKDILGQSNVLKNMLDDFDHLKERELCLQEESEAIHLPVSSEALTSFFPCLNRLHRIVHAKTKKSKKRFSDDMRLLLGRQSLENLAKISELADYLDVLPLIPFCRRAFVNYLTRPEYIENFKRNLDLVDSLVIPRTLQTKSNAVGFGILEKYDGYKYLKRKTCSGFSLKTITSNHFADFFEVFCEIVNFSHNISIRDALFLSIVFKEVQHGCKLPLYDNYLSEYFEMLPEKIRLLLGDAVKVKKNRWKKIKACFCKIAHF